MNRATRNKIMRRELIFWSVGIALGAVYLYIS